MAEARHVGQLGDCLKDPTPHCLVVVITVCGQLVGARRFPAGDKMVPMLKPEDVVRRIAAEWRLLTSAAPSKASLRKRVLENSDLPRPAARTALGKHDSSV
jgi:hypothetical protein